MDISSGTEREVGNHRTVVAGGLLGQPRRANAKVIELQIFSRDAKVTHARTTGQESVPAAVCPAGLPPCGRTPRQVDAADRFSNQSRNLQRFPFSEFE
jgi:hypothetical protein